jgi:hypothetical protein
MGTVDVCKPGSAQVDLLTGLMLSTVMGTVPGKLGQHDNLDVSRGLWHACHVLVTKQ